MNKADKQVAIRKFVAERKISLRAILESRVKASKFKKVSVTCFKNWEVLNKYYYAVNERIWCD